MSKPFYQVSYWSKLFKLWIPHDFKKYSSLQAAQKTVDSYKEHKLGTKFRIQKIETIKIK
jgi:hypothetical protein